LAGRGGDFPAGLPAYPNKLPGFLRVKRWVKHCCLSDHMQLFFTIHGERVAASMPFNKVIGKWDSVLSAPWLKTLRSFANAQDDNLTTGMMN
jgi:hypothetical protein